MRPARHRLAPIVATALFIVAAGALLAAALGGLWLHASAPAPQRVVVSIPPAAPATPPANPPITPAASVSALPPAPDPELIEKSPDGPLPIISSGGKAAWQDYARPFPRADRRPRIAIVIAGLGLSKIATAAAIKNLPRDVTLAFLPYQPIAESLQEARRLGHETLIEMPMEPLDYPRQDPGPRALLTSLDTQQNLDRLHWMMSRGTGYIGMMTYMGSRFATVPDEMRPILFELKQRGLAFVDARADDSGAAVKLAGQIKLPYAVADRLVDAELSGAGIDRQLTSLEDLARRGGSAIGVGSAYPLTIERVAAWAAQLSSRGIALAPLSAVLVH